jgi:hypothetical protein
VPAVFVASGELLEPSEETEPVTATVDHADIRGLATTGREVSKRVMSPSSVIPLLLLADRAHVLLEDDLRGRGRTHHRRQPPEMGRIPGGAAHQPGQRHRIAPVRLDAVPRSFLGS